MSGIVYDFEVYTGKILAPPTLNKLGVMGNLLLRSTSRLPDNVGHKVYFDNLFSSIPLLRHIKDRGIWYISIIRANRTDGRKQRIKNRQRTQKT